MDIGLYYLYISLMINDSYDRVRINSQPQVYRCEPGWSWNPSMMDYDFWSILKGSGTVVFNGVPYELQAGNVFLLKPGDQVSATHNPDDPLSVFAAHFDVFGEDGSTMAIPPAEYPTPGYRMGDLQLLRVMAQGCIRSYREGTDRGVNRAHRYLQLLLIHCRDECASIDSSPPDPRIARTLDAIHEEPSRRWTLAELAQLAYLSRAQFSKRFTADTGVSPMKYVVGLRIARACELLTETSMSIAQIAEALSYTDVFHFSGQFKKETGKAPSAYRAQRQ